MHVYKHRYIGSSIYNGRTRKTHILVLLSRKAFRDDTGVRQSSKIKAAIIFAYSLSGQERHVRNESHDSQRDTKKKERSKKSCYKNTWTNDRTKYHGIASSFPPTPTYVTLLFCFFFLRARHLIEATYRRKAKILRSISTVQGKRGFHVNM